MSRADTIKPEQRRQWRDLVNRMTLLHAELHAAGLIFTGHKMHEAVKQVGYEIAELGGYGEPEAASGSVPT